MKATVLGVVGIGLAAVAYLVWVITMGVPLRIEIHDDDIWVDTQVLGEYYSSISRIRITEIPTGRTVWEGESTTDSGTSPVWCFALKPGPNSLPERLEAFRTLTPGAKELFELVPGREYRVRVWGKTRLNRNSRRFTVPQSEPGADTTYNNRLKLAVTILACARIAPAA